MRTMVRMSIPVEAGNKAILDGTLQKILAESLERLKPEGAYFYTEQGRRTAIMIIDLKDVSEIPGIAEPFFMGVSASVEFIPVMNADDLKKGLGKAMPGR